MGIGHGYILDKEDPQVRIASKQYKINAGYGWLVSSAKELSFVDKRWLTEGKWRINEKLFVESSF